MMENPQHVSIVALGPSSLSFIRYAEAAGGAHSYCDEVWGINMVGGVLQCDRVFHMDDLKIQELRIQNGSPIAEKLTGMLEWMRGHPGPIYSSRAYADYPGVVEYPLQDVLESCGTPYMNNTAVYAICFAIHLKVKKISLFGFDYTYPDVSSAEMGRGCCEYWVGRAMQKGIEVMVVPGSTLLDTNAEPAKKFYGYDTLDLDVEHRDGHWHVEKRVRAVPRNINEIERAYDHAEFAQRSAHAVRGGEALDRLLAYEDVETVLDIGAGDGEHAKIMAAAGKQVTCVSLQPKPETMNGEAAWIQKNIMADIADIGFEYDAIWASHVLEHQPNPNAFLKRCYDLLADDGVLAITVPPGKNEIVGGHLTVWNSGLLIYNLIIAGFDCSEARVSGCYTHLNGHQPYNLSVIVRKKEAELPKLDMDFGDIGRLQAFFPLPVAHGFDGNLRPCNW